MPSNRLCVFGCVTTGVVIHRFPNPKKFKERFTTWVNLLGNTLTHLSDDYIYNNKRVCHIHFTESHQTRYNRLSALAVPSLHLQHYDILHYFPIPKYPTLEKYNQWKEIIELQIEDDDYVYRNYRLCNRHFEDHFVYRSKRLSKSALPSKNILPLASRGTSNVEERPISPCEDESSAQIDDETTVASSDEDKENNSIEEDLTCDNCKGNIEGFRYKCVQCADFDLCAKCEANSEHPLHFMLRIPRPMTYDEIQKILEVLEPLQTLFASTKEIGTVSPKLEHDTESEVEYTNMPFASSIPDPLELTPAQPMKPVVIQMSIDSKIPRKATPKKRVLKGIVQRGCIYQKSNEKDTESSVNKGKSYMKVKKRFGEDPPHRTEPESNKRRRITEDDSDTDKRNLDASEMFTNEEYIDEELLDHELEELLS